MAALDARTHDQVEIQRAYYANTAGRYNDSHLHQQDEHTFALRFMISVLEQFHIQSILDIGSGTGRALLALAQAAPAIAATGIEPSPELREVGYASGIPRTQLLDGDATHLDYPDNAFDLVCEFGVLHHIPKPARAVAEMLRVARKAIFISDCNNFAQGSAPMRLFKQAANAVRLWPAVDFIKTRGKGYAISEGDGLFYSYSVFNNLKQIQQACPAIHLLSTTGSGPNLYRTSTHVALLALKPGPQNASAAANA